MFVITYKDGRRHVYRETEKDLLNLLFNYYWANKEKLKIERIEIDYEH